MTRWLAFTLLVLLLAPARAQEGPTTSIAFVSSQLVAAGYHDGTVSVFRIRPRPTATDPTATEPTVLTEPMWSTRAHRSAVSAIAATTSAVITCSWDRSLRVLDAFDGHERLVGTFDGPAEAICVVDATTVLVAVDRKVVIFDLSDGEVREEHTDPGGRVLTLAVSGDRSVFASGGESREVHVWSAAGTQATLRHPDVVSHIGFLDSGGLLISACRDGQVRSWRSPDSSPARTSPAHDTMITAACAMPAGRLATAALDRKIRVWRLHDMTVLHEFVLEKQNQHALAIDFCAESDMLAIGTARRQVLTIRLTGGR